MTEGPDSLGPGDGLGVGTSAITTDAAAAGTCAFPTPTASGGGTPAASPVSL